MKHSQIPYTTQSHSDMDKNHAAVIVNLLYAFIMDDT